MSAILRARTLVVLPLLVASVMVASMLALAPPADAKTRGQRIHQAVKIVRHQKGDPYNYGSSGPRRFDCSGLIYYSYRRAGFTNIPRTSDGQARFARRIKRRNMRPGDLMFFHYRGNVYHVAVFTGWGKGRRWMIHAPSSGKRVHTAKPWTGSWFPGTLR
jgi:cell wall-associated NlpC family hydrolase